MVTLQVRKVKMHKTPPRAKSTGEEPSLCTIPEGSEMVNKNLSSVTGGHKSGNGEDPYENGSFDANMKTDTNCEEGESDTVAVDPHQVRGIYGDVLSHLIATPFETESMMKLHNMKESVKPKDGRRKRKKPSRKNSITVLSQKQYLRRVGLMPLQGLEEAKAAAAVGKKKTAKTKKRKVQQSSPIKAKEPLPVLHSNVQDPEFTQQPLLHSNIQDHPVFSQPVLHSNVQYHPAFPQPAPHSNFQYHPAFSQSALHSNIHYHTAFSTQSDPPQAQTNQQEIQVAPKIKNQEIEILPASPQAKQRETEKPPQTKQETEKLPQLNVAVPAQKIQRPQIFTDQQKQRRLQWQHKLHQKQKLKLLQQRHELHQQHELEPLQKQQELELLDQKHELQQHCETELLRQQEELQKRREVQQQQELEEELQKERELQIQRELQKQQELEEELQKERELQIRRELQQQRELQLRHELQQQQYDIQLQQQFQQQTALFHDPLPALCYDPVHAAALAQHHLYHQTLANYSYSYNPYQPAFQPGYHHPHSPPPESLQSLLPGVTATAGAPLLTNQNGTTEALAPVASASTKQKLTKSNKGDVAALPVAFGRSPYATESKIAADIATAKWNVEGGEAIGKTGNDSTKMELSGNRVNGKPKRKELNANRVSSPKSKRGERNGTLEDSPQDAAGLPPGWTITIVKRKTGRGTTKHYVSPNNNVFRSLKNAFVFIAILKELEKKNGGKDPTESEALIVFDRRGNKR